MSLPLRVKELVKKIKMKKKNYLKLRTKVVKVEIENQLLGNSKTGLPEVGDGGDAFGGSNVRQGWFDDEKE